MLAPPVRYIKILEENVDQHLVDTSLTCGYWPTEWAYK